MLTGAAMQTHRQVRIQSIEAGGDYLWLVKDKQPAVRQAIERLFAREVISPGCGPLPDNCTTARTMDQQPGRREERGITGSSMLKDYTPWPYVEQVFKLERTVTDGRGRTRQDVRSGGTRSPSLVADAEQLLVIARAEWGIETGLPCRRAVSLQEDASQMRRGSAPPGLAARNPAVVSRAAQQGAPHLAKLQREFQYRCDRARAALAHHTP